MTNEERVQLLITQARNRARTVEGNSHTEAARLAGAVIDLCDALRQHVAAPEPDDTNTPQH